MPNHPDASQSPGWWSQERETAFALFREGKSLNAIARHLGVSKTPVCAWAKSPHWLDRLAQCETDNYQAARDSEKALLESVLTGRTEAIALYRDLLAKDDERKCKECGREGPRVQDRIAAARELCSLAREFTTGKTTKLDELLDAMFGAGGSPDGAIALLLGACRRALNDILRPQSFWQEGLEVPEQALKRLQQVLAPLAEALDQAEGMAQSPSDEGRQDDGIRCEPDQA